MTLQLLLDTADPAAWRMWLPSGLFRGVTTNPTLLRRAGQPCTPEGANKHTGYLVGGTSPFGTRKPLPVYAEASIFALERVWLNGGQRGFLVALDPAELDRVLSPIWVEVAI